MLRLIIVSLLLFFPASVLGFDLAAVKQHCKSKWGSDFSMQAYCLNSQKAAGSTVDAYQKSMRADKVKKGIFDRCGDKWLADYEMVQYCIVEQEGALAALQLTPTGVPDNIIDTISQSCTAKWATDYEMIAYCRNEQITAWKSLQ